MIGGVSFQPSDPNATGAQKSPQQSLQEAIQVLSLRLPKTVGARAVAPGELLNAQGSGGNPRVDSVVNQVMSRMFPTGNAPGGAPVLGGQMPGTSGTMPVSPPVRYDGNAPRPPGQTPLSSWMPQPSGGTPKITFEQPGQSPTPGTPTPPGTMMPNEWASPPPPPPPGFDGTFPNQDGPLMGVPPEPDDNMALMNFLWRSAPPGGKRTGYDGA